MVRERTAGQTGLVDGGSDDRRDPSVLAVEVGGAVDVPLSGPDDGISGTRPEPDRSPGPDWRRAVAVALVGGAIAGIAVGVFVLLGDSHDDGADVSADSEPAEEAGTAITTPPTLPPLETLPPIDDPSRTAGATDDTSAADGEQPDRSPVIERPAYPKVTDVGLADLMQYDIRGAIEALGDDRPRRSETRVELGVGGFVLDVVIERDADRDRYRLVLATGTFEEEIVTDVPGGTSYVTTTRANGERSARSVSNAEILDAVDAGSIGELYDPLIVGPVRPDTYDAAVTRGRGVVTIGEVRLARQFISYVEGAEAPEWQVYAFAPTTEFRPEDRPELMEYAVYVSDTGDVVQVDGVSQIGDITQLVTHRVIEPDEPIVIEIPDVADGSPAADADA